MSCIKTRNDLSIYSEKVIKLPLFASNITDIKKIGQNYTTPILARYGMPYVFQAKKNSRKYCNQNRKTFKA